MLLFVESSCRAIGPRVCSKSLALVVNRSTTTAAVVWGVCEHIERKREFNKIWRAIYTGTKGKSSRHTAMLRDAGTHDDTSLRPARTQDLRKHLRYDPNPASVAAYFSGKGSDYRTEDDAFTFQTLQPSRSARSPSLRIVFVL